MGSIFASIGILFIIDFVQTEISNSHWQRDRTLKINLLTLRDAVIQFKNDTGQYPRELTDITFPYANPPAYLSSGTYKGPYVEVFIYTPHGINGSNINPNPYVKSSVIKDHWTYSPTGTISFPYPTGLDAKGDLYGSY